MSTRAVYSFIGPVFGTKDEVYHVYKHTDGYPSGAAQAIHNALAHAWELPRFEADEFAAAFVAANKVNLFSKDVIDAERDLTDAVIDGKPLITATKEVLKARADQERYGNMGGGGVRLLYSGDVKKVSPSDIEYRYEIRQHQGVGEKIAGGHLLVTAFKTRYGGRTKTEKQIFTGSLDAFTKWVAGEEEAA